MRKLSKNHYLIELFTRSLQGKSWLEIGNDQTELSRQLGRALKTQDFKVASHSPREPHMLRFKDSDLSQVPDKAYDYVLFNWSIGKFTTQTILNEAKRIAREGIIVQDFLSAHGFLSASYQLYEEQQWKEILSSYGRVIVTQQLPEQAIDHGMRQPLQMRLFVVQVDDVRDTLPAAPDPDDFALHFASNMPPNSSTIAFSSHVLPLLPQPPQPNLDAFKDTTTSQWGEERVHATAEKRIDWTALEQSSPQPGEAIATFRPPAEDGPFPHTQEDLLAAADARNFRDVSPEELNVDHKHLEIDTFLGSSGGTAKED